MKKVVFSMLLVLSAMFGEKYKIAIDTVYPPFEYYDGKGNLTGFDVDFTAELSKRVGFEYELVPTTYDIACEQINQKKVDFGISAFGDDEFTEGCEFGTSYLTTDYILIRRADRVDINGTEALRGKKVGFIDSDFVKQTVLGWGGIPVERDGSMHVNLMMLLEEKRVDALVFSGTLLPIIKGNYTYLDAADKEKLELYQQLDAGAGFAVFARMPAHDSDTFVIYPGDGSLKDLKEAINKAIEEMKADGTLNKMFQKYDLIEK